MSVIIANKFDFIAEKLIIACKDPMFGEDQLEPLYVEFLEFLNQNDEQRQQLIDILICNIKKYRTAKEVGGKLLPGTAIAYAMHELRWPEILIFAESENKEFYVKKMETTMLNIIDAYSDDWEDSFFYRRFSK